MDLVENFHKIMHSLTQYVIDIKKIPNKDRKILRLEGLIGCLKITLSFLEKDLNKLKIKRCNDCPKH